VAGDYCPRCGTQLTEYNELHRQSYVFAGPPPDREEPEPSGFNWRQGAPTAVGLAVALGTTYAVMRLLAATSTSTLTINGEPVPLFDPGIINSAMAIAVVAAAIVWVLPHLPGYVKHRRLA